MLFMVIEKFRDNDMLPVYRRLRDKGRVMPEGLRYVDSWIEPNFDRCFQLMETDDLALLDAWRERWSDLVEFDVLPIIKSDEAAARIGVVWEGHPQD